MALPPQTLANKNAIVTGGSRGIGATIATDLAQRGANVLITYTSESSHAKCEALAKEVSSYENKPLFCSFRADAADEKSGPLIVEEAVKQFGEHIDILVNNAGVEFGRKIVDTTTKDFDRIFHVNVLAPLLLTKAVIPKLRAPGRIINISSVGARQGFAELALYTASKSALEGLTRSMAAELGSDGTTVNAVAPGPVQTEMLDQIPESIKEHQRVATSVEKRFGTTNEIANAVAWLASPDASWVSGQVLNLSGGWTYY